MKVHRYWEERWEPQFAEGETPKHCLELKDEADVPPEIWERLQRAEKELEEVRELIEGFFGPAP